MTLACCSLVPRPSPAPVFDRLQYAKTEGEGLVNLTGSRHEDIFTFISPATEKLVPSSSDMFLRLMLFSVSACLVFVASTEQKIGLLPSMAIHISVTTCDACAADHVRFTRPSPSYCKRSNTGAGEGLGTRLSLLSVAVGRHFLSVYACTHIVSFPNHRLLGTRLLFTFELRRYAGS